jgi:hypothetical protein
MITISYFWALGDMAEGLGFEGRWWRAGLEWARAEDD